MAISPPSLIQPLSTGKSLKKNMIIGKMTSVYNKLMGNPAGFVGCIMLEKKIQCLEEKAIPIILFMVTLLEDVSSSVHVVVFKPSNLSFLS